MLEPVSMAVFVPRLRYIPRAVLINSSKPDPRFRPGLALRVNVSISVQVLDKSREMRLPP